MNVDQQTHAAASSTQGFQQIKQQNLLSTKTEDKTTMDAATTKKDDEGFGMKSDLEVPEDTIVKTEAGEGIFGADMELDSVTDSESDSAHELEKNKLAKQSAKFQIVAGEDSDSMFEERLQ